MTVNARVRELRKALKMNQTDFGARIAVRQGYLANIESGQREVTEKIFKLICSEYNVNEDWLRNGTGEMFVDNKEKVIAELAEKFDMNDLNRDIITSLMDLPPDAQRSIADYIKFMAAEYRNNSDK